MSDVKAESKIIAKRLKELRQKFGLSHVQLSNLLKEKKGLKISHDSLQIYEVAEPHSRANANLGMRVEYLIALADIYGVTTDYLLGRTDDPSTNPIATDDLKLSHDAVTSIACCSDLPCFHKMIESHLFWPLLLRIEELKRITHKEYYYKEKEKKEHFELDQFYDDLLNDLIIDFEDKYPHLRGRYHVSTGESAIFYFKQEIQYGFSKIIDEIIDYNLDK